MHQMNQLIDHAAFVKLLTERFPQVATDIDDISEGLLHLEMATLARATEAAIKTGDFATVGAHVQFVDDIFRAAAPDVENVVYVSYLENAFLDASEPNQKTARGMLTPILQKALQDLEDHWNAIMTQAIEAGNTSEKVSQEEVFRQVSEKAN